MRELALLCQRAENEFVGARRHHGPVCFVVWAGAARAPPTVVHSNLLLPPPCNVRLIICNTMVKHELASSAYNERREQCEAGVRVLGQFYPNVRALRDVTIEQLEQHRSTGSDLSTLPARCDGKYACD